MKLELITEKEAMEEPKIRKIQIWAQPMCDGSIEIRGRKDTIGPGCNLVTFFQSGVVEIYTTNIEYLGIEIRNIFMEGCDCEEDRL